MKQIDIGEFVGQDSFHGSCILCSPPTGSPRREIARPLKRVFFMGTYSKLHNYTYQEIRKCFPEYSIKENYMPDWLLSSNNTRLELDIFIPMRFLAIEIQGEQHVNYTPFFHKTYKHFQDQQKRDKEKQDLCYGQGITLIEVFSVDDVDTLVKKINSKKIINLQTPLSLKTAAQVKRLKRTIRRGQKPTTHIIQEIAFLYIRCEVKQENIFDEQILSVANKNRRELHKRIEKIKYNHWLTKQTKWI